MNEIFNLCVAFLLWLGPIFGMTYREINVWIFCIIEPLVFILMVIYIIKLKRNAKIIK
jgi:hypothetical protein